MALLSLSLCLVSVILSLVMSPVTESCELSGVKLENNEYTGIVVAIHEDEPENLELIDAIKEMFISGSDYLYTATKKRAFFKEVTILIPKTWSDSPSYTSPGNAHFEGADVIVGAYNPRFSPGGADGAVPYTKQFAGCGEQSLYIHMTSSFLLNAGRWSPIVGDYGRVLVHEWGHYRWGLFNEYPDHITEQDRAKEVYYSERNQIWEPVSCTSDWRFTPLKYTGRRSPNPYRRCTGDQTDGYEKGCVFVPSSDQPLHVTGSVMHSFLNFNQIVNFCDNNPNDPGNLHNSEAPTKQNERCDGRSCWEVMREHPDFNGNTNPPREVHDKTPTFFVVRSKVMRIVLVLDTSGSMDTSERHLKLAGAARTYIKRMAAPGTFIGIVDFDTDATTISKLREMTSDIERSALANLVPVDANGGTCIGCGLEEALNILTADGDPGGSKILLITDGEDGEPTRTRAILDEVIKKKVTIDVVAVTNAETILHIEYLATNTGGQLYLQTDDSTSGGFQHASSDNSGGASVLETRVELQSSVVAFDANVRSMQGSVVIDDTVGRLTTFDFTYFRSNPSGGATLEIRVQSPSGRAYHRFSGYYELDIAFKKVTITIPDIAEPGVWEYYIYNQDTSVAHDVIVSVASYPHQEGVDPITVSSFLCGSLREMFNNKPLVVYTEVRQGFKPVVGATVIVTVEAPGGPVDLELYDDGAGLDLTENDGIYSSSFNQFSGIGFYGFNVRVLNNGQAKVLSGPSSSHSRTGIYFKPELLLSGNITEYLDLSIALPGAPLPEIVAVPAPHFTRGVSGGARSVSETPPEWDPSIDTFAPNKITDLAVLNTSFSLGTVAITFTAPGDDFDFGNAHHYVIRWANSSKELRNKSSTTNEIYQIDVLHGNLFSPAPNRDKEIMIIQVATIPQHLETYSVVLGLYAVDESGNEGDMSNTAKVTFRKVIPTPEPVQTTARTDAVSSTREPTTETGDQNCQFWYHPYLGYFISGYCED